jgi:hypothetical protein
MFRSRRSVAGLVALVTIAAVLPGLCAFDGAVLFEPIWVLLPDPAPVLSVLPVVKTPEQPDSLLSLLASRGPPSSVLA